MNALLRSRATLGSAWTLATLLAVAACDDASAPATPDLDEPVLAEATMDAATQQVDVQQENLFGQAEQQRQRDRARGRDRPALNRTGLAVEFAAAAVDLAGDILDREGADDRQRALLTEAERLLAAAEEALAAGDTGQAVRHAHAACWTALKAWILPGGVTVEETEAVRSLAEGLLAEAAAAVGDDDGTPALILSWATTFYTHGVDRLEEGQPRGVAALWKAAVLSHYLLA